ncbi:MAG: hypothetical protein IKW85_00870 [Muribaculaceae bacterium]|nr:hypothetical protein [Muribaculaceae bacterium]
MKTINICIIAILIVMTACNSENKSTNRQFAFLDSLGITVNDKLMLGDTLTLPDIYCGDPSQQHNDVDGQQLERKQYEALVVPAGKRFTDEMSNWKLMGVRDMGSGVTLAAFYNGNGIGYCVDLMTYDRQGHLLDAINTREQHLLWRIYLNDINNDTVFTLDSHLTFNGDRVTLHRMMGRCVMDFEGDLKGAPIWQQQWDQEYIINAKGHFVLQGQQVVMEKGKVDHYAALDFKSWDMLICSMHDAGIMDTWNEYSELVNSTYDPDYEYNPFPWDVAQLYQMNPQRFLRWMAIHRGQDNRLLPCFKLMPDDRPALLEEIGRLDDKSARQWLTSIVNSWDDKPLTRHR